MKYIKVSPELSGYRRNSKDSTTFVANELYTEKELVRIGVNVINRIGLSPVEVSKARVYWFFGARFESTTPTTEKL
jgi:hypothetical protein